MSQTETGFAYLRSGKVHGFDTTKRGLLIGYDMMPLMGLRKMERHLLERGTIVRVRLVADPKAKEWGATKDGKPILDFAGWQGGLSKTRKRAFQSLAGFALGDDRNARRLLYRLWTPALHRRHAIRQEREAMALIARLGYGVARMRFARQKE